MTIDTSSSLTFIPLSPLTIELEGIHLIEASAGTGKTYTIATIFIRLLLEKQLRVDQILVVTFTEAATQELRCKIRDRLLHLLYIFQQGHCHQEDSLSLQFLECYTDYSQIIKLLTDALRNFDEAAIFTIHSFCRQILQNNAFESNVLFDTELVKEQMPFLKMIVADFWRQHFYHYDQTIVRYLAEQGYQQPDDLLEILNQGRYIEQPLLTIIPDHIDINEENVKNLVQQFQQTVHKVHHFWLKVREEIEQLLLSHPTLNRNKYRKDSVKNYCNMIHQFLILPTFKLSDDEQKILEKFTLSGLSEGTKKGGNPPVHEFFHQWTALYTIYQELSNCFKKVLLNLKIKLLYYATEALEKQKQQNNIQFFNDLLTKLYFALQGKLGPFLAKSILKRYPAALIDEFQDTDPVQYEIFRKIYCIEQHVLFLIGDPKQAIYSFRGADIFAYMTASKDAKQRHTLTENWRSETELVQAVNTLFSHQKPINPFLFEEIIFHPVTPSPQKEILQSLTMPLSHFQILLITRQQANLEPDKVITKEWAYRTISEMVAFEIRNLLFLGEKKQLFIGKKAVSAGDITILVRKHKQAYFIQQALLQLQIPCVLYSDDNIFETHEVMEIERILLACLEPNNESALKAALTTDILGMTAQELHFLLEKEDFKWQQRIKSFYRYHHMWKNVGFIQMFHTVIVEEQVAKRLLNYPNGERRLTNILHVIELLQQAATQFKLGMATLCYWLAQKRYFTDIKEEEHQLRLESDENRVKIYTIHRSKGLEFNIVFCPFLWDGHLNLDKNYFIFHQGNQLILDVGSAEQLQHFQDAQREMLAENMRLCYVALTRAKHRCYTVWGAFKEAEQSPLASLFHHHFDHQMSDEQIWTELKNLEQLSNNAIKINKVANESTYFVPNRAELPKLEEKCFIGQITQSWKVTSFSALSSMQTIDQPDHDNVTMHYPTVYATAEMQPSIFTFPRGAKAGQFIHELFECIDFTNLNKDHVEEKLQQFSYEPSKWLAVIVQLVKNVTTTPLLPTQLTLSQISLSARLTELEFYYPVSHVSVQGLVNIFSHFQEDKLITPLIQQLRRLNFSPLQGMMKGYIDMVFEYQNKFYLVDYKSNFLGLLPENYDINQLEPIMVQELYILQYYIYAVALHRYLSIHVENYRYSQHFGGVYYLFLRGMQPTLNMHNGIYYDLPNMLLIQKLSDYFYAN